MELKKVAGRASELILKYKYAAVILLVGLVLLWLPGKSLKWEQQQTDSSAKETTVMSREEALAEILQSIQGAGRVKVLLSTESGEETVYQTDSDTSNGTDNSSVRTDTVIITDSKRDESGLIRQVNPPVYLGAVVVCDGADNATVRLAITQAVGKITGLGADAICVLKMKCSGGIEYENLEEKYCCCCNFAGSLRRYLC